MGVKAESSGYDWETDGFCLPQEGDSVLLTNSCFCWPHQVEYNEKGEVMARSAKTELSGDLGRRRFYGP